MTQNLFCLYRILYIYSGESMKKIVIIGFYKPKTNGPSTHIQGLTNSLRRANEIIIISMWEKGFPFLGKWNDNGIEVYQEKLWYPYKLTVVQSFIHTAKRAFLLRKNIDLFHSHGIFFSGICFLDKKKPFVLTIHGYSSQETVSHGRIKKDSFVFKIMRWIEKEVIRRADAVIVVNSNLKKWVIRELNAEEEKIFVIPNGIDPEKFRPFDASSVRANLGYSINDKIIIFVKAFTEQSGIKYLIQAIPHIYKEHPEIKLLAIGGGPLSTELTKEVERLNLKDQVKLLNSVPNEKIPFYLNASDIFVFPSIPMSQTEETFGISLIEAMACGKPVIATSIGGPKEIIEGGDNVGILIPPNDFKAISESVNKLLDHPHQAKIIGENAKEYVTSKYSWDVVLKEIRKVYRYASNLHYDFSK